MTQTIRKMGVVAVMAVAALGAVAQDKVLDRYDDVDDVQKTRVTRGMLERVPAELAGGLELPAVKALLDRIESMRLLSSDKLKAEKELRVKVPKALAKEGFETVLDQEVNGTQVRMMRSRRDPGRVVLVVTEGQKTTVVSMKGSFD